MTTKEAIEHLRTIQIYSIQDGYTDEAREAIDMAIKVLEEWNSKHPVYENITELREHLERILASCNTEGDYNQGFIMGLSLYIDELEKFENTEQKIEQAIKDCRNCKHGHYNDVWDTYFCYCDENCTTWDKWEPAQPELRKNNKTIL